MPIPVIIATQSIPGFLQNQTGALQLAALFTPTSWRQVGLPSGWSINSAGLCTGAATVPGPYNVRVWASNADGESAPADFCMGIEASAASTGTDLDLVWDIVTNRVTLDVPPPLASAVAGASAPGDPALAIAAAPAGKARRAAALAAAIAGRKFGSDLVIRFRLTKLGLPIALAATDLGWTLKEFDTDGVLCASTSAIYAAGPPVLYRAYGLLTGDALAGEISGQQAPYGTRLAVRCALSITWTNGDHGTTPLTGSAFGGTTETMESSAFYLAIDALQKAS